MTPGLRLCFFFSVVCILHDIFLLAVSFFMLMRFYGQKDGDGGASRLAVICFDRYGRRGQRHPPVSDVIIARIFFLRNFRIV